MNDCMINNPVTFSQLKPKKYISFILLIFIVLIIYILNQNVSNSIDIPGIIKENYKLNLFVSKEQLLEITTQNKILIKGEAYLFKINNISDNMQIMNNQNIFEVIIDLELPEKYRIKNLLVEAKVIISTEKVYQKLWKNLIEKE